MSRSWQRLAIVFSVSAALTAYLYHVPNSEGVPQMERIRLLSASMKLVSFVVCQSVVFSSIDRILFFPFFQGFYLGNIGFCTCLVCSTQQWHFIEKIEETRSDHWSESIRIGSSIKLDFNVLPLLDRKHNDWRSSGSNLYSSCHSEGRSTGLVSCRGLLPWWSFLYGFNWYFRSILLISSWMIDRFWSLLKKRIIQ